MKKNIPIFMWLYVLFLMHLPSPIRTHVCLPIRMFMRTHLHFYKYSYFRIISIHSPILTYQSFKFVSAQFSRTIHVHLTVIILSSGSQSVCITSEGSSWCRFPTRCTVGLEDFGSRMSLETVVILKADRQEIVRASQNDAVVYYAVNCAVPASRGGHGGD